MIHIFHTLKNMESEYSPLTKTDPRFNCNVFEDDDRFDATSYSMKTVVLLEKVSSYRKTRGFVQVDHHTHTSFSQFWSLDLIVDGVPMKVTMLTEKDIEEFEKAFMTYHLGTGKTWKEQTEELLFSDE